jgi:hypothetical protein
MSVRAPIPSQRLGKIVREIVYAKRLCSGTPAGLGVCAASIHVVGKRLPSPGKGVTRNHGAFHGAP